MTPYMYPGFLPYSTVLVPSYQESAYIQQTLLASTQSATAPPLAPNPTGRDAGGEEQQAAGRTAVSARLRAGLAEVGLMDGWDVVTFWTLHQATTLTPTRASTIVRRTAW